MQTQCTLTNPRSRRYLQSDLAQIIVKKTLFIPQTESRLACSFLRINYFAIILGLTNSNTNDTAQWQTSTTPHGHVCLVAAPYFVWTSTERVLCALRYAEHGRFSERAPPNPTFTSQVKNFWTNNYVVDLLQSTKMLDIWMNAREWKVYIFKSVTLAFLCHPYFMHVQWIAYCEGAILSLTRSLAHSLAHSVVIRCATAGYVVRAPFKYSSKSIGFPRAKHHIGFIFSCENLTDIGQISLCWKC